jgi:hypothetical protein
MPDCSAVSLSPDDFCESSSVPSDDTASAFLLLSEESLAPTVSASSPTAAVPDSPEEAAGAGEAQPAAIAADVRMARIVLIYFLDISISPLK